MSDVLLKIIGSFKVIFLITFWPSRSLSFASVWNDRDLRFTILSKMTAHVFRHSSRRRRATKWTSSSDRHPFSQFDVLLLIHIVKATSEWSDNNTCIIAWIYLIISQTNIKRKSDHAPRSVAFFLLLSISSARTICSSSTWRPLSNH